MNDNNPPAQPGRVSELAMMKLPIVGRLGPGDTVIFDDPEMFQRMRQGPT